MTFRELHACEAHTFVNCTFFFSPAWFFPLLHSPRAASSSVHTFLFARSLRKTDDNARLYLAVTISAPTTISPPLHSDLRSSFPLIQSTLVGCTPSETWILSCTHPMCAARERMVSWLYNIYMKLFLFGVKSHLHQCLLSLPIDLKFLESFG